MQKMKKVYKNAGITLIALVITIIVMLILAGVSLNATIGENGILTQAKDAKIITSAAAFDEYMQEWFVDKKIEDKTYTINDFYREHNFLKRKLSTDEEGNIYYQYFFNRSEVEGTEFIEHFGDAGEGDPFLMEDVYGLNPDFSIYYYGSNGDIKFGKIITEIIDETTKVSFQNDKLAIAIARATGVAKDEMTIGNMKNVSTLSLNLNNEDSGITNLDDLYYLPNLSELKVYSLNLENVNGLKYMNKLNKLTFKKCTISDFSGMRYLANCTSIVVVDNGINNENIDIFLENIKALQKLEILDIETMYSNLTDIEKINNGLSSMASKSSLKKLSLYSNRISGILDVKGFTKLESLELSNNYYISGINNLKDCKNIYKVSLTNNSFVDVSQLNYFKDGIYYYIYLKGNSSLDSSKIIANSSLFTKATSYTIDSKYAQYIEGIKNIDYSTTSDDGGNIVDGTIEYIPDSVTAVSLNNCKKLTNIDFLLDKTNVTTLSMQNCTGVSQEEFKKVVSTLVNLKTLNISRCPQLKDISFLKEANIKSLYIAGCPNISDISWINTDVMGSLDLSKSGVKFLSSESENTKKLNSLTISALTINADADPTLIQTAISNIQTTISITGSDTEKIQWNKKLSNCTEISSLRMYALNWNAITKMDLSKCTKLKTLSLQTLNVSEDFEIDISNCTELTKIILDSISNNKYHFKVPNLSNCNKLENIVIKNAYMTNEEFNNMCMQLSNATNLKNVDLSYNSISDMSGLSHLKNSKLTYLSLMNNNISIVSGIDEMQYLNQLVLKNNNLDNKSIPTIVSLVKSYNKLNAIYLYGNNITDFGELNNLDIVKKSLLNAP